MLYYKNPSIPGTTAGGWCGWSEDRWRVWEWSWRGWIIEVFRAKIWISIFLVNTQMNANRVQFSFGNNLNNLSSTKTAAKGQDRSLKNSSRFLKLWLWLEFQKTSFYFLFSRFSGPELYIEPPPPHKMMFAPGLFSLINDQYTGSTHQNWRLLVYKLFLSKIISRSHFMGFP